MVRNNSSFLINWSDTKPSSDAADSLASFDVSDLERILVEAYPSFEPLKVFIEHLKTFYDEDLRLLPGKAQDVYALLENLDEICWALDLQSSH